MLWVDIDCNILCVLVVWNAGKTICCDKTMYQGILNLVGHKTPFDFSESRSVRWRVMVIATICGRKAGLAHHGPFLARSNSSSAPQQRGLRAHSIKTTRTMQSLCILLLDGTSAGDNVASQWLVTCSASTILRSWLAVIKGRHRAESDPCQPHGWRRNAARVVSVQAASIRQEDSGRKIA